MPAAVGIDLGSTHCIVGIWHHGRPEIIANHHGLRATPTMVAFTDEEVLIGEAALTQMPKNQKNTVFGFKWMVGVAHAELEPHVKELLSSAPFDCSVDASGAARVAVTHKGEERSISADALCVHLFEHLKSIAEQFSGETVGKCVLSVPADFTAAQKDALRACGQAAGLPFSLVVSDPIATAVAYGLDRTGMCVTNYFVTVFTEHFE
jgi:heat shock 70kDa protein 1/2/6/8